MFPKISKNFCFSQTNDFGQIFRKFSFYFKNSI